MADIGSINMKIELPQEALDLLQAIKDAVEAIEAQPFVYPQVPVTAINFEAPRG